MKKKNNEPKKTSDLRERAENAFRAKTGAELASPAGLTQEGASMLLHELQVHQIELEMQNEELRRSEAELETARTRYFDLYDLAPVGYITVSEKGLIIEGNLTAAALLGVSRGELTKQPFTRFIAKDDQDIYYRHRKQLFETEETQACELRLLKSGGVPFWVRLHAVAARNDDGGTMCRVVLSDISDRKRMEREREELTTALRKKNGEMESILYASSHDLRTPLVSIQGFNDRIQKTLEEISFVLAKNEPAEQLHAEIAPFLTNDIPTAVHHIGLSAGKMERLVNGILRLSRLSCAVPVPELLDMNALTGRLVDSLKFQIQQAQATVTVGDLPSCWADPHELEQALMNLLSNAVKYRDPVRPLAIVITGTVKGNYAIYAIADNGIGIKPGHYEQIWGLFSRLDPSGAVAGEGIGLTLVKRIIERHNGDIRVESEPGVGSTFSLSLPRTGTS